MARRLPNCEGRRRESRVGEIANGNADEPWKPGVLPKHSGPARRTEMKGHGVAALGCPLPLSGLSGDGDLIITEARLVANHGAGASLAGQAVAHGVA